MKRIVVISDCSDVAYNEIRATIVNELDKNRINDIEVEPLVKSKEFSKINCAFLVRLMAEIYNPIDTVFLVILNPLKTTVKNRAYVMGETKNGFKFVSSNIGTLSWLVKDFGIKCVYEFCKENLSGGSYVPFGGKYFQAPMALKIAEGIPFDMLGEKRKKDFLNQFNIKDGTVVHIDNFGTSKINGRSPKVNEGTQLSIYINGRRKGKAIFTRCMKNLPTGTWTIYPGSSLRNLPELGQVRQLGSASKLGIKIGDKIVFK